MAEVLVHFDEPVEIDAGVYDARVCGGVAEDNLWEGWLEFRPAGVETATWIRGPRETEQPNIDDLRYWAGGLTLAYLQGALKRALAHEGTPVTHTDVLAATREFHLDTPAAANPRPASKKRRT